MSERRESLLLDLKVLLGELAGLDLADAPPNASFFELGLDSLFLTQATTAIKNKFKVKISFRQLVEDFSSLAGIAFYLDEKLPSLAVPPAMMAASPVAAPSAELQPSPTDPDAGCVQSDPEPTPRLEPVAEEQ